MTSRTGTPTIPSVIRNVCIHVANEQPLLADLYDLPSADDAGLLCTNVRTMDGKRPVFIDHGESTFFFPYLVIRFLEIPEAEMRGRKPSVRRAAPAVAPVEAIADDWAAELPEPGEDDAEDVPSLLPVAVPSGALATPEDADLDIELEIDEGFLQRIRDI